MRPPAHLLREHRSHTVARAMEGALAYQRQRVAWQTATGEPAEQAYTAMQAERDRLVAEGLWNAARGALAAAWDACEAELQTYHLGEAPP